MSAPSGFVEAASAQCIHAYQGRTASLAYWQVVGAVCPTHQMDTDSEHDRVQVIP